MSDSSDYMTYQTSNKLGFDVDVLSEILDKVELTSSYYYRTSFTGDWGIKLPQEDNVAFFHIVTHGEFWFEVPKLKIKGLAEQGDILILFNGMEHTMTSAPKVKTELALDFRSKANLTSSQVLEYGDQSKLKSNVVCGHFCFNRWPDHPFLNSMPDIIHIKNMENSHSPWLATLLNIIEHEAKSSQPGSTTLIKKLTEIIFVQALRIQMRKSTKKESFFKLIENPQISKTLAAIHHNLDQKWSLEDLSEIAGMSRTNYSVKFKELSGMTPLDYLTSCRLDKAKQLLTETSQSVPEVSEAIGYPAHEHFQKLFKKKIGQTPSAYRKENSKRV